MIKKRTANKKAAKNLADLLQAIATTGTSKLAESIGRDAPFISRLKSEESKLSLNEIAAFLAATNLELTPTFEDMITVERRLHEALATLATEGLRKTAQDEESDSGKVTIDTRMYNTLQYLANVGIRHLTIEGDE